MSLLIDALKKAEQEKKEAARRLKEAREKSGSGIQLEETSMETGAHAEAVANEHTGEDTPQSGLSLITEKKSTRDFSSSPLEEYTLEEELDPESASADAKLASVQLTLQQEDTSAHTVSESAEPGQGDKKPLPGERTFLLNNLTIEESTSKPLDDTDQPQIKETFTDTLSSSRVSRPVISAAELAKDMGGGRAAPTPVAAQTVFTAVNTVSGQRQILEWTVFLGLFTVILLAGGSLYYLKITPSAINTSSPLVARGIEADLQPPVIVPLPEVVTETGTSPSPDAQVNTAPDSSGTGSVQEETITVMPEADTTVVLQDTVPEMTGQTVMELPPAAPATPVQQAILPTEPVTEPYASLPEDIPVDTAAIAISRSRSVDKSDLLINSAYTDYSTGNYSRAEITYRQVLESMPGNRDALLGLAALAHHKGQMQQAYELYLRVLKLYPRDIVATTALINIQGSTDPVRSESVLKLMLQDQPETAFLHFALGNNYASQSRWADAQSAFFEAYRLEPDNGDFAYNLAVSLDQLGQGKAALDYYQKALELADHKEPGFNTSAVLARVSNLTTQPQMQ